MIEKDRIKAVIIDDEANARETLEALLREFFPEVEVIGKADDGISGLELVERLRPELVFLDVEMPGLSGLELLQKVAFRDFEIIFTTAHRSYSLAAIKFSALDYLLKPISVEELQSAIRKVEERKTNRQLAERLRILEEHLHNPNSRSMRIALPAREGLQLVRVDTILRCEGDNNYTYFYFQDASKVVVSKTLREYEQLFGDAGFFRIFKSHLVNLRHVEKYLRGRGGQVRMSDGTILPVSRDRKKELMEQLMRIN